MASHHLTITLPDELAEAVKAHVASGAYATETEVVRDGLRLLVARDQLLDKWLSSEVSQAYEALAKDSAQLPSLEVLREQITAKLAK